MVDILEASGARRPKPGLAATPTSTQSEGQLAAPAVEMGAALKKGGEVVASIGAKLDKSSAEQAYAEGMEKVGRDAQGVPTVELPAFAITHSDKAFEAGARAGLLSKYREDAQRGMLDIANKHQADPNTFDAEAKDYVKNFAPSADLQTRQLAKAEAEKFRQQHFLTISNGAVKRQTAMAKDSIVVQIDSTTNDIYALARQGGTGSPEFKEAATRLEGLYDNLKGNPIFEVGRERADSEMRATIDRARGFEASGKVASIYDTQGEKAAEKWIVQNIRDNPDLKISDAQRSGLIEVSRNALAARKGENKAQIDANRSSANVLAKAMEDGKPLPQGAVDQAIETAAKLGDVETAAKLLTSKQIYGRNEASRGLSDEERVRLATAAPVVGGVQVRIYGRLLQGGLSPVMAFGLMGNLSMESSFNTAARNPADGRDGSDSIGIAQWNSDRARALSAFAAARGKPVTDVETQADFIVHELSTTEGRARAALQAARTPEEAGRAAIGYFRPAGFSWANPEGAHNSGKRIQQARVLAATLAGASPEAAQAAAQSQFTPEQLAANPYLASTWLKSQLAGNRELIDAAKSVLQAAGSTIDKGNLPNAEYLAGAIQIANQNPDKLGQQRDEILAKIRGVDEAEDANRSGGTAGAKLVQDVMRRAQGASIFVQMQAEATKAAVERGAKNLKEQPWNEAVQRGWAKVEPPPLDLTNQGNLNTGFAMRAEIAGAIAARSGVGQSALSPGDVAQVSNVWNYGTPDQKSSILAAISQLPDQMIEPTLRSLGEDKQSGELAFVAGLHRESPVAAMAVIRGQQALLANPRFAPKPEEWRSDAMEKSLPLSIAAPERAGIRQYIGAAVKSVYAGLSARDGDESGALSQARLDEAAGIVTGGLVTHNGSKLIPPTRGMTQDQFDKLLWSLPDSDFAAAATKSGLRVTAQDVRRNFVLRGVADGRYALQARNSPAEWLYQPPVLGRDIDNTAGGYQGEQRFILDLKGRPPGEVTRPAETRSVFGLGFVPNMGR